MFTHVVIGSNDLEQARSFYDAAFAALGGQPGEIGAGGRLVYTHEGSRLMITKPIDGNPATAANGGTIGILAASVEHVSAWHAAGIAHGGKAIETPPPSVPMGHSLPIFETPMETNCRSELVLLGESGDPIEARVLSSEAPVATRGKER